MTAQMAIAICDGTFPGQDSAGLITHAYRNGKEVFNLWENVTQSASPHEPADKED